jgi:predicted lactoylglutathione lyase
VPRFQRLLNLAASAGIRRNLARFAAEADYGRSSGHDSGGPAVFGNSPRILLQSPQCALRFMWSHSDASIISIFGTMLTRRELPADFAAVSFFPLAKGESQTMDQRVSVVTLGVKDLGSSKRFPSTASVGSRYMRTNGIIFFHTGGMVFALFLRDHLAADFQADPATFGHAPMALAYNVRAKNEVNPLIQRAVAAGATILEPPRDAPWGGYSGDFADPDGFAWEVAWNPA